MLKCLVKFSLLSIDRVFANIHSIHLAVINRILSSLYSNDRSRSQSHFQFNFRICNTAQLWCLLTWTNLAVKIPSATGSHSARSSIVMSTSKIPTSDSRLLSADLPKYQRQRRTWRSTFQCSQYVQLISMYPLLKVEEANTGTSIPHYWGGCAYSRNQSKPFFEGRSPSEVQLTFLFVSYGKANSMFFITTQQQSAC